MREVSPKELREYNEKSFKETALTELLIRAGVTWAPRKVARFLLANGVDIMKGDND